MWTKRHSLDTISGQYVSKYLNQDVFPITLDSFKQAGRQKQPCSAHTCHAKSCGWTSLCLASNALSLRRTSSPLPWASLFYQHGYSALRKTSSLLPLVCLFYRSGCSFLRMTFCHIPLVCLFYHRGCSKFLCKTFAQVHISKTKEISSDNVLRKTD